MVGRVADWDVEKERGRGQSIIISWSSESIRTVRSLTSILLYLPVSMSKVKVQCLLWLMRKA